MGFIQDFKDFAFKGNLIDMAVGIVMGGAVAAIVKSFLDNIITPLIAMVGGVPDMSQMKYAIGEKIPKLNEAGEQIMNSKGEGVTEQAAIHYGAFIQNVIDFTILAFVIFVALKIAAKWMKKAEEDTPPSDEVVLLTEIRDSLKKS
jgi:large conductance mechanosensitive channel